MSHPQSDHSSALSSTTGDKTLIMDDQVEKVQAWDWPTRAFHWLLVSSIAGAWLSNKFADSFGDTLMVWHRWNGYFILTLLVFRLFWGFFGSSTARFFNFIPSPMRALRYLVATMKGKAPHYLGHNPLGTMMILALLALCLVQGVLGLYSIEHNELVAGPLKRTISFELSEELTKWHRRGYKALLALVFIHVSVNLFYTFVKKEPLIKTMITGKAPAREDYTDTKAMQPVTMLNLRAALCFFAAMATVYGGVILMGGKF